MQCWELPSNQYIQQLAKVSQHWLMVKGEETNESDGIFLTPKKFVQQQILHIKLSEDYLVIQWTFFSKIVIVILLLWEERNTARALQLQICSQFITFWIVINDLAKNYLQYLVIYTSQCKIIYQTLVNHLIWRGILLAKKPYWLSQNRKNITAAKWMCSWQQTQTSAILPCWSSSVQWHQCMLI